MIDSWDHALHNLHAARDSGSLTTLSLSVQEHARSDSARSLRAATEPTTPPATPTPSNETPLHTYPSMSECHKRLGDRLIPSPLRLTTVRDDHFGERLIPSPLIPQAESESLGNLSAAASGNNNNNNPQPAQMPPAQMLSAQFPGQPTCPMQQMPGQMPPGQMPPPAIGRPCAPTPPGQTPAVYPHLVAACQPVSFPDSGTARAASPVVAVTAMPLATATPGLHPELLRAAGVRLILRSMVRYHALHHSAFLLSTYLSISMYQSIYPSIYPSINPFTNPSINPSIYLSYYLPILLSDNLTIFTILPCYILLSN